MTDKIVIQGARGNNLKHVDVAIPKGKLVVFAGISGSGKSTLVFDTIAAEAARQLRDTFPPYIRNRMPQREAPDADNIDHLSTAIMIGQRTWGGNARSTVGTVSDVAPLLRLLFSRCAQPGAGTSNAYSFNDPQGMCTACSGLGYVAEFDMKRILDTDQSLNQGAIRFPGHQVGACLWQVYANSGLYDPDKPLKDYTRQEWDDFLHGSGVTVTIHNTTGKVWGSSYKQTYEGFQDRIERLYLHRDLNSLHKASRDIVERYTVRRPCPVCQGRRLNAAALNSKLLGYSIADLGQMEISDAASVLTGVKHPAGAALVCKITEKLGHITDMGLGYLNLDRPSDSLSGGEMQRLKMVRHLGSSLVDLMYIFDEPSAGLHPADVDKLIKLLVNLRDRGNTMLVVEHNEQIIRTADQVIELGPGAGKNGGKIVFQGTPAQLREANTLTAQGLREVMQRKKAPRPPRGYLTIRHASLHNLKDISLQIPCGCIVCVTGVAGAGKSSLVCGELAAQYPDAVHVSQAPIGTSSRSTPATYTGIMDEIRRVMGKANGVSPTMFSSNSKGACPVCKGKGMVRIDMAFMDAVTLPCECCRGSRYSEQALSYRYHGKNILEILKMTVEEAAGFFSGNQRICSKLEHLRSVGMGYITLGQPTSTLSGGECQRIRLASMLEESNRVYLMDEPSTGLHSHDIGVLLRLLNGLVDQGNSLVLAEHNPRMILQSDWVIDLGPGGGKDGGYVIFQGTPDDLLQCRQSVTAKYLRKILDQTASE